MENQIISLEALPVLKNSIKEAGANFEAMAIEAGLGADVIVTSENRPLVKSMVAEITKRYTEFENQRKALKNELLKDYEELMVTYKEEISDRYTRLVEQAKKAIAASEKMEVDEKESSAKEYFSEAIAAAELPYLTFAQLGLKINLTVSAKKLREEIDAFISRVKDDESLILAEEYKAEILTEYKRNGLNASRAILDVKGRKQAEKLEAKKIEEQRYEQRCSQLRRLAMISCELPAVYHHVRYSDIAVTLEDVRQSNDDKWFEIHTDLSDRIRDAIAKDKHDIAPAPTVQAAAPETKQAPISDVKESEPTQTLTFEATATLTQFKALAEYMRANNIKFKTLNS